MFGKYGRKTPKPLFEPRVNRLGAISEIGPQPLQTGEGMSLAERMKIDQIKRDRIARANAEAIARKKEMQGFDPPYEAGPQWPDAAGPSASPPIGSNDVRALQKPIQADAMAATLHEAAHAPGFDPAYKNIYTGPSAAAPAPDFGAVEKELYTALRAPAAEADRYAPIIGPPQLSPPKPQHPWRPAPKKPPWAFDPKEPVDPKAPAYAPKAPFDPKKAAKVKTPDYIPGEAPKLEKPSFAKPIFSRSSMKPFQQDEGDYDEMAGQAPRPHITRATKRPKGRVLTEYVADEGAGARGYVIVGDRGAELVVSGAKRIGPNTWRVPSGAIFSVEGLPGNGGGMGYSIKEAPFVGQ